MKIVIIGGGAYGTALANQLAYNPKNEIYILVRDKRVSEELNISHCNTKYFPGRSLHSKIHASTDYNILGTTNIVFLTLPTKSIEEITDGLSQHLSPDSLVVNMAKGIFEGGETIVAFLKRKLPQQQIVSWKGASFSAEMINRIPTLITLGFEHIGQLKIMSEITEGTNIFIDYTTDIKGVELLSALKNIYAIIMGNIDARFNAANTRFLILTKAIGEIKVILKALGGKEDTLFLGCGIGDISLTALNDLSRNRTLGLLIGKGFYNNSFQNNSIVLEGIKTLKLIDTVLNEDLRNKLPLFMELFSFLILKNKIILDFDFNQLFRRNYKTVLTYGTFDLIHYGHMEILRRAKAMGDQLIVGLSTDEFNTLKGKTCEMPYEKRKEFLESIDYVDLVIPENNWKQKVQDINNYQVDIFVMGDDWKSKFDFLKDYCKVCYLPRTKGISTTAIKSIIR